MTKYKPSPAPASVTDDGYNEILAKYKINPSEVSLQITNDDEELYAVNGRVKKIPASITKVMTSFAVLKRLPLAHKFYTRLLSDGKNLYFQGGGDPSFVSESMWFLVNEFRRSHIKSIPGNIVVDDSLFDRVRWDDTRQDDRVDRAYDSPVGALSFNWNAVNVFVRPGAKAGDKGGVVVDPESDFYDLVNNTVTVAGPAKKELAVSISNTEKLITVSGEITVGTPEKPVYKGVVDPDLWSGINLLSFLEQRDIAVTGKVVAGKTPAGAETVASFESKNLAFILTDMNKFSNNFVAEMLTKDIAAQEMKTGATLKRGVEMIREELEKIGISRSEFTIENPSGLTRNNQISAQVMNRVLVNIKKDYSLYPTFLSSLPIAGIDGTMKKRMKGTPGEGWVRAKTGSLDGVVSLAGYAGRRDGQVLTFSFLYNGPRDEATVREAFDQLILHALK